MTIIIDGLVETSNFNEAYHYCESEYGYEGEAWEMIKASGDMEILYDFLFQDGVYVELED